MTRMGRKTASHDQCIPGSRKLFVSSKECKLLNPEVLDFEYDRKSGRFQAFAEQPLRFVNNALGYEIKGRKRIPGIIGQDCQW